MTELTVLDHARRFLTVDFDVAWNTLSRDCKRSTLSLLLNARKVCSVLRALGGFPALSFEIERRAMNVHHGIPEPHSARIDLLPGDEVNTVA